MSVDDILNYTPDEDEDLYALLGCDESATVRKRIFKNILLNHLLSLRRQKKLLLFIGFFCIFLEGYSYAFVNVGRGRTNKIHLA